MNYSEKKTKMFEILKEFDDYAKRFDELDLRILKSNIENNFMRCYSPSPNEHLEDHSRMFGVYRKFLDIVGKLYQYREKERFPIAEMAFEYEIETNDREPTDVKNNGDFIKSRLGFLNW